MKRTYLIQRLTTPIGRPNPYSFGAGSSRLTDEANDLVSIIWNFDYMGAAEFEHGKVQQALEQIADYSKKDGAVTGEIVPQKDRVIYYLCGKKMEEEVKKRINQLYNNEGALELHSICGLRNSFERKDSDLKGWLELDNGFIFFVDKDMYQKTLDLFEIKN